MILDTGLKVLMAASALMTIILGSRSQIKNFYVSFLH